MNNRAMILARTVDGVVGLNNKLPWNIPEELKLFKAISLSYKNMVMGRTTFENLPGLLPDRRHIVLSTDTGGSNETVSVEESVKNVLDRFKTFIVIGGVSIWKQFLPYIDTVHLSILNVPYKGDILYKENFNKFYTNDMVTYKEFTYYEMFRRVQ